MSLTEIVPYLSTVNAILNGIATLLIVAALVMIKLRQEWWHKVLMLSAAGVSALFLVSYVIYHFHVGSVPYEGTGILRVIYFVILVPHIILAMTLVPLVPMSLYYGLKEQRHKHVKVVRWAAPIWLYVSVTGVVVYWMLYHL